MEETKLDAVAIDGPAGAGKSTIARAVADRLGFLYVDTGAMYRAVALAAMREGVDLEDERAMGRTARAATIDFDPQSGHVLLNGEDVSRQIRSPEVTASVRYAARAKPVREDLVRRQQAIAATRPVVMEGRDITTVVLPAARWRIYLTAAPEERARRRCEEMRAAGHEVDPEAILEQILDRDASDEKVGALRHARQLAEAGDGVAAIDTTSMTPEAVADAVVALVRRAPEGT